MKIFFYWIFFCLSIAIFDTPTFAATKEYKKITVNVIQAQKDLKQFFIQTQTTTYELPNTSSLKKQSTPKLNRW